MRVLIGGGTPGKGGVEAFILDLVRALQHDGIECDVLVDKEGIAGSTELLAAGARLRRVYPLKRNPMRHMREMRRLFAETRYDALWMNQTVVNTIIPLVIARRYGVARRILHSHNSQNMGSSLSGLLHRLHRPLLPMLATVRVACSDKAADYFFPHSAWTFVPNAVDTDVYAFNREQRTRVRSELDLEPDVCVIIHVARIGVAKNQMFSIEIMRAMASYDPNAVLLFVGDGEDRDRCEAMVRQLGLHDHVRFLGVRDDIPAIMAAADAAILPSTFEGLPYVIVEAQAAALPILVSDVVTRMCAVTHYVHFAPLSDGPDAWARRILGMAKADESREVSLLAGTSFDHAVTDSFLVAIARGGIPAPEVR